MPLEDQCRKNESALQFCAIHPPNNSYMRTKFSSFFRVDFTCSQHSASWPDLRARDRCCTCDGERGESRWLERIVMLEGSTTRLGHIRTAHSRGTARYGRVPWTIVCATVEKFQMRSLARRMRARANRSEGLLDGLVKRQRTSPVNGFSEEMRRELRASAETARRTNVVIGFRHEHSS